MLLKSLTLGAGTLVLAALVAIPKPAAAQLSAGERLWFQCRACHTLAQGEAHKLGPNLYGIMDERAGTRPGFQYSPALADTRIVWDDATLDKWIEQPNSVLTGHTMVYRGMANAEQRAVLIDFIKLNTRAVSASR